MDYEIRRSKLSPLGDKLFQHICRLYESGARLWTKEMFFDIEEEISKSPLPTSTMIRTMNGELIRERIPKEIGSLDGQQGRRRPVIIFQLYQEMVYRIEENYSQDIVDEYTAAYPEEEYDQQKLFHTCALNLGWSTEEPSTLAIEYTLLRAAWNDTWANWSKSTTCKELVAIFKNKTKLPDTISRVVCFGLGNPDWDLDDSKSIPTCDGLPCRRRLTQHAAALTMAAVFGELLGTNPLPVLAQDPQYSPVAQRLLSELGIEVVGGHGSLGFTHVDDDTAVFSCSPNVPVKQVVADIARPAALIWNSIRPSCEERTEWTITVEDGVECRVSPWLTDEDSPRTRALVENYDAWKFPNEPDRFPELGIYIRRD